MFWCKNLDDNMYHREQYKIIKKAVHFKFWGKFHYSLWLLKSSKVIHKLKLNERHHECLCAAVHAGQTWEHHDISQGEAQSKRVRSGGWDGEKRLDDGWDVQSRERSLTKSSLSAQPTNVRPDVTGARKLIKTAPDWHWGDDNVTYECKWNQRSDL